MGKSTLIATIPGNVFKAEALRPDITQANAKQASARRVILALCVIQDIGAKIAMQQDTKELWVKFRLLERTMSHREVTLVEKLAVKRGYVN